MKFGNIAWERTERNIRRVASLMQTTIQSQAPVRTGALRRSIEVVPTMGTDGEWDILVYYKQYGQYTNWGTRPYYDRSQQNKDLFGMKRWVGYERGKGGIRPQYWLSLRGKEQLFQGPIEQGLQADMYQFMQDAIKNLQNL
jgi:hypothetical protein